MLIKRLIKRSCELLRYVFENQWMYILSHKEILLNEKSYNSIIVIALISFILPTASIMAHLSDLLMFYLLHLSPKQFVPNTNVFYDGIIKELGHIGDNVDLIGSTFSII